MVTRGLKLARFYASTAQRVLFLSWTRTSHSGILTEERPQVANAKKAHKVERMNTMTKSRIFVVLAATGALACLLMLNRNQPTNAAAKDSSAPTVLKNVQTGDLVFKRIGRMSFGPNGLLLVVDRDAASIVAIDTGDRGPVKKLKKRIDNVDDLVAASMGARPGGVQILDMAVNSQSGKIYLSVVRKSDNQSAVLTVDADGNIANFDLKSAKHVRVTLPGKIRNITGVKFANDRVLAAGQCNEEFASKIYSIPLPLTHGDSAKIYSTETYHVSHRRWETRAPIQSFVPLEENGKHFIVGSFSCTPIAKFPLDDLESGAKVKGTSVVELGSGNRPVDMFTYEKDGKQWLVVNTDRFHHKRRPIGPSQYWGCRVDMAYMAAEETNEEAARRAVNERKGPEGMEVLETLFGVKHIDKLDNNEVVVLRDDNGKLDLEALHFHGAVSIIL